jgi:hypothetical protein
MHKKISLALALLVMLASGYGIWAASAWPWKAALFPLAIGVPLFAMALAEAMWVVLGSTEQPAEGVELAAHAPGRAVLVGGAWMLAFFLAIILLGFPIAVPLFMLLYLRLQGGERWIISLVITAAVFGVFYGLFDALLHLPFPAGLLLSWLGLA